MSRSWSVPRRSATVRDALGAVLSGVDIEERKQVEQDRERFLVEVEHYSAEMAATLNSIADGIAVLDPEGQLVRLNPAVGKICRFTEEDTRSTLMEQLALMGVNTPAGQPFPVNELPVTRALLANMFLT